ncbi:hypothetical protein DL96DRAFT_1222618 [Flagelloscypha sp. PMI_526]|nr:hypothetical protein DL96DRAFT_1222618 [Flagelloscypha sp. PMI_526]
MFFNLVAVSSLLALGAQAAVHQVKVGADGLAFTPAQLDGVANGDDVQFMFMAKNHTVTQSTFADPCKAMAGGVNSGFMLAPNQTDNMPTWTITINDASAPLWFYCRQKAPANHCAMGMVFSINPTAEKSQDAFVAAAKASNSTAPAASGAASGSAGAASPASTGAAESAASTDSAAGAASTSASDTSAAAANAPNPNGAKDCRCRLSRKRLRRCWCYR